MAPRYSDDVKNIIINLKNFFDLEKQSKSAISMDNVMDRLEVATKIPKTSLYRIVKGKLATKKSKKSGKSIEIDNFDKQFIIRTIHNFYRRKEFPTLDKLLKILREEINFRGGRTTLFRFLKKLGFRYKKQDGRKFLVERAEVVMLRHQYLRKMKKIRKEKPAANIFYLDETWINSNHTPKKCWVDKDEKGGVNVPIGKGKRLIVVHAGGHNGFIPEAKLCFVSKSNSQDYHDEMNGKHFEEWIETKVLPNLPKGSVIVMDNASYHSVRSEKAPTSNSKKEDMKNWLLQNNVSVPEKINKKDLYELVKIHKPRLPKYRIDEMAREHGHQIIRLPPYHCDLNPIELIWAQIKDYVAKHNKDFNIKTIEKLYEEALSKVSDKDWQNAIRHVMELENSYWQKEIYVIFKLNRFV